MDNMINIYYSMAEFYQATGGTLEQHFDFTIHRMEEIHTNPPIVSPLFRANYYTFVFIHSGRGRYIIDNHTYETRPRTMYFTNPGHIKGFEIHELCQGYIITCAETFLKQHVHIDIFAEFPFLIAEVAPPQYTDQSTFAVFDQLNAQLLSEFQSHSSYQAQILGSFMRVLLLKIKEMFWNTYDPLHEADRGSHIVRTFKHNLESHFRKLATGKIDTMYQVHDYAAAQQLHPNYLSTVVKSKTGKSVQTWIVEKTIAEAQALLSRSSTSIQEVAYRLAFKEPGHFTRFFKKYTGITPSDFRKALHAPQ